METCIVEYDVNYGIRWAVLLEPIAEVYLLPYVFLALNCWERKW